MCGIFYILSNTSCNLDDNIIENIIEKIKYRGPDFTNIVRDNNDIFVHTLLAIQGHNPQPYKYNNNYLLFNGEIYGTSSLEKSKNEGIIKYDNIPNNFTSESEFLIDYFYKNNFTKLDELDGEFVINYIDKKHNQIHIITDPFGTKPFCFYRDDNYFIASSYESCVKRSIEHLNLTGEIEFVIPNTHYIYDANNYNLISKTEIVKWDFNPRYSNYDRWNIAFDNSIKKRTNTDKGIFVPLSSGYDSGCIVSAMVKLCKPFNSYTFKGREDINTLESRKILIEKSSNSFYYINPKVNIEDKYREYCKRIENYTGYHVDGTPYTNIYEAYSCFGIYQIFQEARQDNQIIFLSGHGGDEIFSDYGNEENRSASILELDYTNVRSKWPNFDSAYGRNIIQMFERVGGCFGIESRYPFLDKQVVQEFLWLRDDLKNSEFKQCIAQYMRKLNFPFVENKKCSVRVITDKEGGNDYFFEIVKKINNELGIKTDVYPKLCPIKKELYRPTLNYKPKINYYPLFFDKITNTNIHQYLYQKIRYYQNYSHIKNYLKWKKKLTDNEIIDMLENKLINTSINFEEIDINKALYEICKFFDFNVNNIIKFLKQMYASQIGINFNYIFNKNNKDYNFQNPLIYFEVGYGRCGDIARFCIDLFKAGFNYEGRLLQFKNHVSCEININGVWKLIEIDLNCNHNNNVLEGIQVIKKETIDKYVTMTAHNPIYYMINNGGYGQSSILSGYPSYFFHKFDNFHIILEKNVNDEILLKENLYKDLERRKKIKNDPTLYKYIIHYTSCWNTWFWYYYKIYGLFDNNIKTTYSKEIFNKIISDYTYDSNNNLLHQMLQFIDIEELDNSKVKISWMKDDIIKKYKILVSDKSREWNYIKVYNKNIENYINKISLEQNNFDKIYDDINSNIYNYETEDNNIIIDKQNFEKLYVSIIPVDYYGYSIDRLYYLPSEELII